MESGSEGESNRKNNNHNHNNSNSPSDGWKKPKRQMKTPFQLETLEKTYAMEMYPSEATRVELAEKLQLTDRQLQMWFCHRRLKDKKEGMGRKSKAATPVARAASMDELVAEPEGSRSRSRSRSDSASGTVQGSGSSQYEYEDDVPLVRRGYELSPLVGMERRVIACVEAQLGEPLREDGPILGMDFDELPPGAFGAPIVVTEQWQRTRRSYDDKVFEQSHAKPVKAAMRGLNEPVEPIMRYDASRRISPHLYGLPVDGPTTKGLSFEQGKGQISKGYGIHGKLTGVNLLSQESKQGQFFSPPKDESVPQNEDASQTGLKRKGDEAGIGSEVQVHEKRIRKELEKQDHLRRKREEQMRKEIEKQDRERRKEEERMMREKQRMEERLQREERREIERREKFLQREELKAERMRQKEELRREKEAARLKAARERATARRIVRESMELIEDERLELMELAASSKGLPSMISLDYDSLQDLESFRDSLSAFPPKSVHLKRPFAVQPWIHSEDNVGNLLLDSRLLGEIHIALLKLIIKDVEDVARTPSSGLGTNQYTVANPEGGHPQIVEGAYMWGFDIRNWQKHLNPLTWPEILRQFALSAGFGPELKKERVERAGFNDNDEVNRYDDIVSMLRNGSAAVNAAAAMQEKGFPPPRKSRHRLTPGTVKFAAYHVLSLEGSKGLTLLELADKIQYFLITPFFFKKSGLRDLSTSKTPDASISVALSRDPILFERIAPSTYCVRTAFRKDPADAEAIISAAREKIQNFANGVLAMENVDDADKDDGSDCDVAEGPEIDDLGTLSNANKSSDQYNEGVGTFSGNGKENLNLRMDIAGHTTDQCSNVTGKGSVASYPGHGGREIDESKSGEPWVQGLTEGEYSDLCVEERLNALVALIGVANEGNFIRAVLEDRLDAANALKKQIWAEAQLDKRRMKEENVPKFYDSYSIVAAEGSQSPLAVNNTTDEASLSTAVKEKPSMGADNIHNDTSLGQGTPIQQNGLAAERSRLQLKSFVGHRAEEMYVYRSLPLGHDRRRNRYWQFVASSSRYDPGSGRIFVELIDGSWRLIDSEEAFDALLMSLDTRGIRESQLQIMLQTIETSFKESVRKTSLCSNTGQRGTAIEIEGAEIGFSPARTGGAESPSSAVCASNSDSLEPSSSFKIELGRHETEKKNALKRYLDLQMWIWRECFNSSSLCAMTYGKNGHTPLLGICDLCLDSYIFKESLCSSCGRTFAFNDKVNYMEHVIQLVGRREGNTKNVLSSDLSHPLRLRLIKALLNFLEASVPPEAFLPSLTDERRKTWGSDLHNASTTGDLQQASSFALMGIPTLVIKAVSLCHVAQHNIPVSKQLALQRAILTQLEGVIVRDRLSLKFETTDELLASCALSGRAVRDSAHHGPIPQLPWIPQTTAAVALRLLELDASVMYIPSQKTEPEDEGITVEFLSLAPIRSVLYRYLLKLLSFMLKSNVLLPCLLYPQKLPSRYSYMKSIRKVEPRGPDRDEHMRKESWPVRGSSKTRQVVRGRGGGRPRGRGRRRIGFAISGYRRQSVRDKETLAQVLSQQVHRTHGKSHGRGRRTVRRRRTEQKAAVQAPLHRLGNDEWIGEETGKMHMVDADTSNSVEASESDDDAVRHEGGTWVPGTDVASNRSPWGAVEASDEDVNGSEDDNGYEDEEEEEEEEVEGDDDLNDGIVGNEDVIRDEDSDSLVSGDYSD
ncbi:hypothetical protein RJ639_044839 [Escallonia herrerae]|uniref:Homeobox domain-containing protein n=1 Tax=Escallonia herrerae TaxID=1293975 RepID=A0AA88WAQ0_9ASTE|nr:hypothetical protein RJ639_044839 [Escallonia herrerae]